MGGAFTVALRRYQTAVAVEPSDVRTGAEAEVLDEVGVLEDELGEGEEHLQ